MRERRWLRWWEGRPSLLALDLLVFAGALYFELHSAVVQDKLGDPLFLTALAALVLTVPLLRRRYPLVVLAVGLAGPFAGLTLLPGTIGLYSVAARFGFGWVTAVSTLLISVVNFPYRGDFTLDDLPGLSLAFVLFGLGPALAGMWMHQRAVLLGVLRDRAEEAERTRSLLAEQAVAAERRRIAREMHDVVAHRVSAIALQAGALSVHAPDERTERSAETIRQVSVTALDELREILRVLREEDESPARVTGPGLLGSVEQLVADAQATGARIELDLPDPLPQVPEQVERAVYRVVQEALTNAGKHAPHAAVQVRVHATAEELEVAVVNRLTPRPAGVPGSGYGLLGMRERVELAGGRLTAGRAEGGLFRVSARFPLEERTS